MKNAAYFSIICTALTIGGIMLNIDIEQAKNSFPNIIEQTIKGNEIIITKKGRPVVKMIAITKKHKKKRLFGSAKGLIKMAADFNKTPEDFRNYI